MKIYSWNVNGIRAVCNKDLFNPFFNDYDFDVLCIQETKAHVEQLDESITNINGYHSYFVSGIKKGYSSLAVYSKVKPNEIKLLDIAEFDDEGRYMEVWFDSCIVINCYFPNSQEKGKRLDYKLRFNNAIKTRLDELTNQNQKVVICGDFNVAHQEIDLKNPKTNTTNPGFLPEERLWMTQFLNSGYIDTFRFIHGELVKYSWWSYRMNAREKNVGWRIDYFVTNHLLKDNIKDADIINNVFGSDHCPVYLELSI